MIKITNSTTIKITRSDGSMSETIVERLGFLRWRGSRTESSPDGRDSGEVVHGRTKASVRRQLGMEQIVRRQVQKGGDRSVQIQSGGDIRWDLNR